MCAVCTRPCGTAEEMLRSFWRSNGTLLPTQRVAHWACCLAGGVTGVPAL